MKRIHLTISLRRELRLTRNSTLGLCTCTAMLIGLLTFPHLSHATADADRGKELFEKRCTGCHSLDQDKEGPRLRGVYGRQTGGISTFKYSAALQSAHITWDDASLEKWLTDTDSLIADNDMAYRVPKADERADIIRYLKLVSGK